MRTSLIELAVTIDSESTTRRYVDGAPIHLGFQEDVWTQCLALDELAARYGVAFTFFYPLGEHAASDGRAETLAALLAQRHDLGVHLHRPFALWSVERIAQELQREREHLEWVTGRRATVVRAGGYNTGDGPAWIDAVSQSGFQIDSSVWSGASTRHSRELAQAAGILADAWGLGGLRFDHRRAPAAGIYRTSADALGCMGIGPLLEAPAATAFYDEIEPGPFRIDPHRMTLDTMIASIEHLRRHATVERMLVVILTHSNGISRHGRLSGVGKRLAGLLEWASESGTPIRPLASLATEDLSRYGPVYAVEQPEAWQSVDRSELASLVTRCSRCGSRLTVPSCAECGWETRRIRPTLIDALSEPLDEPCAATPLSRSARRVRAALALSGGALGIAWGTLLYPAARISSALPRRDSAARGTRTLKDGSEAARRRRAGWRR